MLKYKIVQLGQKSTGVVLFSGSKSPNFFIERSTDITLNTIPLHGKLIATFVLITFWTAYLFVTLAIDNFKFAPIQVNWMIGPSLKTLIETGGMTKNLILNQNQWWRIITAELSHAGIIHLGLNAFSLWFTGIVLEPDWGPVRFFFVFISSSVTASFFSLCYGSSKTVSVGGSGAVFGLMSSIFTFIIENWTNIKLPRVIFTAMSLGMAISLSLSFLPHIDWRAHVGGFVAGILSSLTFIKDIQQKNKQTDFEKEAKQNEVELERNMIRESIANSFKPILDKKITIERPPQLNNHINRLNFFHDEQKYVKFNVKSKRIWTLRVLAFLCLLGVNGLLLYFSLLQKEQDTNKRLLTLIEF